MKYPFEKIETKWQKYWADKKVYKTDMKDTKDKIYCLEMFIYPSGSKLHIGHWYNYGPADSWARYKKLTGHNVFEPMGYDAFGLPAENYAIKTGVHPQDSTLQNIADIRVQLKRMGGMYDWDAELKTCDPEYYKWNQWLFLKLYKKGLAYRKNAPVNWCPDCNTVLANEQVASEGECERCGTPVIQKNLTQWFFKITQYAEELLDGLNKIDWPEKTKLSQRNWIGKSTGTEVDFKLADIDKTLSVFTTRPDTLFGVTYMVLAPEHPLVEEITVRHRKTAVEEYKMKTRRLTEIERTSTTKEKTGVPTGAHAINPVNGEKIPIWTADYVLLSYGTGAVMAVPAHDERDFEFARRFDLPIRKAILEPGTEEDDELEEAYTGQGTMIDSGDFTGTESSEGIKKVTEYLEKKDEGRHKVNYRLRDWLISRQRYWGTPIPVIYCDKCGEVPVAEEDLPVRLPYDVEFKPSGESPLKSNKEFLHVKCPECKGEAKRDADTMDTFVDSSWYYLRYLNPRKDDEIFDNERAEKWTPVDMYVGGMEHANGHLLYSRFIHKFLRDLGYVDSDEPFQKLIHQGTITNEGAKMSKSKGNVVNPDTFIKSEGADVFRLYLMFMGPFEQGGDWSDKGISGTKRFVQRVYDLFEENKNLLKDIKPAEKYSLDKLEEKEKSAYRKINQTLNKFGTELEDFRFNTAIAALMELMNELGSNLSACRDDLKAYILQRLAVMIAPVAPHLGEECWKMLGSKKSLFEKPVWFDVDKDSLVDESIKIAVQVNGKLRATIDMPPDSEQDAVAEAAKSDPKVKKFIDEKNIVKEIFVKNKIFNIVAK